MLTTQPRSPMQWMESPCKSILPKYGIGSVQLRTPNHWKTDCGQGTILSAQYTTAPPIKGNAILPISNNFMDMLADTNKGTYKHIIPFAGSSIKIINLLGDNLSTPLILGIPSNAQLPLAKQQL